MSSGDLASGDAAGQENPAADERLRVMIVDDHEVWRIGLKQALEADGRAVVVAEATDGASAIAMAAEAMPDVVVMKSEPAQSIAEAVHATSRGEPVITAALAGLVLNEFRTLAAKEPNEPLLTMTETEILRLVAKGYKYREIAEQRFIALKTVQNHVQNILGKLHMHTKYELIAYAIRHGLDRAADQPAPQVSPKHE
jgi:DNA-binding NarL/FixJ family response regulator